MKKSVLAAAGISLMVVLAQFIIACSPFSGSADGNLKVGLDSEMTSGLIARNIFEESGTDDSEVLRLTVELSGGYKAKKSRNIKSQEDAYIIFEGIPSGVKVNVSVLLEKVRSFYSDYEGKEYSSELYSGRKTGVVISTGNSGINISLKNSTAPFFTYTSADSFYKLNDSAAPESPVVLKYGARLSVPAGYANWITDIYVDDNVYAFWTDDRNMLSKIEEELLSTINSSGDYVSETVNIEKCSFDTDADFSITEIQNSSTAIETDYFDRGLSLSGKISYTDNSEGKIYAGWAVYYETPLGKKNVKISDISECTVYSSASFSIESVKYTGKTRSDKSGKEYILSSEFDPSAFEITENWNEQSVKVGTENYQDAVAAIQSNLDSSCYPVGDWTLNFSRYGDEYSGYEMRLRYLMPEISEGSLVLYGSSLQFEWKTEKGWQLSSPARLYTSMGEDPLPAYDVERVWYKNGEPLAPIDTDSTDSIDVLAEGRGTGEYSLKIKLSVDESRTGRLAPDGTAIGTDGFSEEKEFGPVTVTSNEIGILAALAVPEFAVVRLDGDGGEILTDTEISLNEAETLYFAAYEVENGAPGSSPLSGYNCEWYLNGVKIDSDDEAFDFTDSTINFKPLTIDFVKYNVAIDSVNTLMLVLWQTDPDDPLYSNSMDEKLLSRSESLEFTLTAD